MSTSTVTAFNGTSTFSSDLQQVISRAVSIASLPITQLNNEVTSLTKEQSTLSSLSATFSTLQASELAIGNAAASGNYGISYSDDSVATASVGTGASLGSYTIQVVDPGSRSSAASTTTVSDPTTQSISSSASFTLTANGEQYTNITPPPGANTLTSLVTAINTATQGAVQATIVNVGTRAQPSYQISIQNTSYGALPITLTDSDGNNLLGTPTAATSVLYRVNGQPPDPADPLSSDSRTVDISPQISVNVLTEGTTDINVTQDISGVSKALSAFVTAYNSASQALQAQQGTSGGALTGMGEIASLSRSLSDIANFQGTGSIQSIASLGLNFDSNGVLSFDPSVLATAASSDFSGVMSFLGNSTSGGFLQAADSTLNGITDSNTGTIALALTSVAGEIVHTNTQIATNQDRVNLMQKNLTAQMDSADALIAQLQQQTTYLTGLFTAMTASQNQTALG